MCVLCFCNPETPLAGNNRPTRSTTPAASASVRPSNVQENHFPNQGKEDELRAGREGRPSSWENELILEVPQSSGEKMVRGRMD